MERKIKAAQKDGGLSRDAAIEEVVADACEMVLGNSKAIERLAKEKPGLAKQIADWLHEFFSDIRKSFEGVEARHEEAKAMTDYMDELVKLWDDALVEAVENRNYKTRKSSINEGAESSQTKYQLREYSKQQIENWSKSKRIVIYTGETQMRQFIADARGDNVENKKMYFGMVPHTMAKAVLASTGLDVEGFNCSISAYEIRKIFKDHGNQSKEEERGQRAITEDDIVSIPDILLNADRIDLSPKLYNGKPAICFVKHGNDRVTVTAYVSDKHLDLVVQTMFANIKKGNLATPTDVQASVNTPEANYGTVSNSSIRNSEPNVKKSMRDSAEGLTKEEARAQAAAYTRLKAENAELRRRVEYWKGQTQRTKKATVRQADVNRFARQLIKRYGSTADQSYIRQALQEMGDYLVQNNGEALDFACRSRTRNKVIDTKP